MPKPYRLPVDDGDRNFSVYRLDDTSLLVVKNALCVNARLGGPVLSGGRCAVGNNLARFFVDDDVPSYFQHTNSFWFGRAHGNHLFYP